MGNVESTNLVKIVAAFVTGVVIALGSALIYLRTSEMAHAEPIALTQSVPDVSAPAATQLPAAAPVSTPLTAEPASSPAATQQTLPRLIAQRQVVIVPIPHKPQPAKPVRTPVPIPKHTPFSTYPCPHFECRSTHPAEARCIPKFNMGGDGRTRKGDTVCSAGFGRRRWPR